MLNGQSIYMRCTSHLQIRKSSKVYFKGEWPDQSSAALHPKYYCFLHLSISLRRLFITVNKAKAKCGPQLFFITFLQYTQIISTTQENKSFHCGHRGYGLNAVALFLINFHQSFGQKKSEEVCQSVSSVWCLSFSAAAMHSPPSWHAVENMRWLIHRWVKQLVYGLFASDIKKKKCLKGSNSIYDFWKHFFLNSQEQFFRLLSSAKSHVG